MTGRPRFDRDEVLAKAMRLFWVKGYHGTTTRDVQDFLGMHPGSVYAAFGGKADMFKETVTAYADLVIGELNKAMAENDSVAEGFKSFFRQTLDPTRENQPSNMCMLSMTVRDFTHDEEILEHTHAMLERVGAVFTRYCDQALAQGDFIQPEDMTSGLSRFLQIQLLGLRTAVSNGVVGAELAELIEDVFRRIEPKVS